MRNIFSFKSEILNLRLDVFLKSQSELFNFSRNRIIFFIKSGYVKIDDVIVVKPSFPLNKNSKIDLTVPKEENNNQDIAPLEHDLQIVYENENIIIVNKPRGLTVHPGAGNRDKTIVNILKWIGTEKFSDIRGFDRIGIVHRLDKDTSGLMIIAKNNNAHYLISEMIKNRTVERKYLCLCHNIPRFMSGKIENKIIRDSRNLEKMKIDNYNQEAKIAITNYKVLDTYFNNKFSLMECKLDTGRTHQIRLHMLSIDCPVVGDQVYKSKNFHSISGVDYDFAEFTRNVKYQMLHSYSLRFTEPITGEEIYIKSLPEDFNIDINF